MGTAPLRVRPCGRIGGAIGVVDAAARARLAQHLGVNASLLWWQPGDAAVWVADRDQAREDDGARPVDCGDSGLDSVDAVVRYMQAASGPLVLASADREGRLMLARDAVGERSLFYAEIKDGLIFASSLRALLASGLIDARLDHASLAAYLSYAYVPGERTLIAGVRKLLPGEVVEYARGRCVRHRYWSMPEEQEALAGATIADEELLKARLRGVLAEAVRRRLPKDGERVGASLSGGIDSSLVVALARQLHTGPLSTYSISFGPSYPNELEWSCLVARHCDTEHRVVELSPEVIRHHLDDTLGLLSDPIGDPLTVPNALLFREAACEVGVLLNGEGGDPCFGGPKNVPMLLAELLGDGANSIEHEEYARARSYLRAHQKCFDDLPRLLAEDVLQATRAAALEREIAGHLGDPRWPSFMNKLMALNITYKGAHHILPKVDALAAAAGVLARSPLFDRAVVEMAFAIPPQLKIRGTIEKYLLKEAVRDILPAAILERPKSGMLVPVEGWFAGPVLGDARARILDGLAP
ncbi:MAG: asparagine synthetase B family protein, partial [Vicinamibacteria bacterium]|nr:asparagine synthetase B family protein [Vicinamibacteria bacterium]